jgi:hypothetical protein
MITIIHDRIDIRWELAPAIKKRLVKQLVGELAPKFPAETLPGAVERCLAKCSLHELPKRQRKALKQAVAAGPAEWIAARLRTTIGHWLASYENPVNLSFQRTLRIPDDGGIYPLPPGFGELPIRRIATYAEQVPEDWRAFGDIAIPLRQAEALWMHFYSPFSPPAVVKVGTGLVNAINGQLWTDGLTFAPQGHLVLPDQPWLDGYCVEPGIIRQFVAAPIGDGSTAEEQLEGTTHGGLQFEVFPLKPSLYLEKLVRPEMPETFEELVDAAIWEIIDSHHRVRHANESCLTATGPSLGMAAGGAMEQEIYQDPWGPEAWDLERPVRLWVHLCNARRWHELTGEPPPGKPLSAVDYGLQGLPWFDYYDADRAALQGSERLRTPKTTAELPVLRESACEQIDASVDVGRVIHLGPKMKEWESKRR